jgi:hypothetical protein
LPSLGLSRLSAFIGRISRFKPLFTFNPPTHHLISSRKISYRSCHLLPKPDSSSSTPRHLLGAAQVHQARLFASASSESTFNIHHLAKQLSTESCIPRFLTHILIFHSMSAMRYSFPSATFSRQLRSLASETDANSLLQDDETQVGQQKRNQGFP